MDIIDPAFIANEVDKLIDPETLSPELKTHASILHIRAMVRRALARRHDPIAKAKEFVETGQDDLFDGILQPYYPVKRIGPENEKLSLYMRRDILTSTDVDLIDSRMRKAGESLIKHCDALQAWFKSKPAA